MDGAGTFDPDAGWVKGGGNFNLFDQNKPTPSTTPKPLITSGFWEATAFVSYDTKGLGSFGFIQPAILTVLADFPGIGSGLKLELICNVGALGAAGMTGEDEGWQPLDTPAYRRFVPLGPARCVHRLWNRAGRGIRPCSDVYRLSRREDWGRRDRFIRVSGACAGG